MTLHAAIVGSGPNGLTAACMLARAGWEVTVYEAGKLPGGAARSAELFGPGLISDLGASVHPLAAASTAYAEITASAPPGSGGLDFAHPPVAAAHPGDGKGAAPALLHRSLERTTAELGEDAELWRWIFGPLVNNWEAVKEAIFTPPSRPFAGISRGHHDDALSSLRAVRRLLWAGTSRGAAFAQFGAVGAMPARNLMRSFKTDRARDLFAGLAAHSTAPLTRPLTAAVGVILAAAAHTEGWPVIRGGSQQLVDLLTADLRAHGGEIVTDFRVEGLRDVPLTGLRLGVRKNLRRRGYRIEGRRAGDRGPRRRTGEEVADVVVLDMTPRQMLQMEGLHLTDRVARRLQRWKYGPGVVKIDYLVDGPIPWQAEGLDGAGTVHLGGSAEQITASEAAANSGVLPGRPYVLLTQPSAADDSRTPDHRTVCWAYAHVPLGLDAAGTARAAELIEQEICRWAPQFRDAVLERKVWSPADLETWNANLVGGNVSAGLSTIGQTFAGPASMRRPYSAGMEAVYACSAATPPGGGAHGMSGYNAARAVLQDTQSHL
ncbi:phytoene desaturase family protein [Nesterenkonia sphaerica]|uniref:NAD(P)/FAD-dependent oxidoreductase n=1 Tax=Nesterenkonia sphaerica TaxID=1804988 RepID=A0A5R9AMZ8_9MICC|nr:NAD(P)/FAD-dependent oxidoreductase [Nesterenkonia sphaerica]TLP79997.1 NAD(P)/FAD-dependent oxidoreductase [Nesterenkonia sphaerica]